MAGTMTFTVTSEADLDADIAAIDAGGTAAAVNTAYTFVLTSDLSLTNNIPAINLLGGDTLTIEGSNPDGNNYAATIDGGGGVRGFVVNSGTVLLSNLTLTALTAPGGASGTPGGGGAIYVADGASVSTSNVTFNSDRASSGTPAGGAVFVAQGGTFSISGGSLAGSGHAAGNGIFIQGGNSITLSDTTITGTIADQTGAGLGSGAGTLDILGAVTLAASDQFTGGIEIGSAAGATGTLTLAAPVAAGAGTIAFAALTGEVLAIGTGDVPTGAIIGFAPNTGAGSPSSNSIDLMGIGAPDGYALSSTNTLTVTGTAGSAALRLDASADYGNAAFVLSADSAGTGTDVTVVQSGYHIGSEADLNAALAEIDAGGKFAAAGVTYTLTFTVDITLSADLYAIDLMAGSSVTIDGAGFTIDGGGAHRGFFDYAGGLTLQNMTIQNAVAAGGAGGAGATPGGGGAGLGGALFVGSGATATLSDVTFLDDAAIGGTGGGAGSGLGGGGGLGGAGGAGSGGLASAGGGGGIGTTATGGAAVGGSGGAGIVVGAPSGNSGTGNDPAGGSGGIQGGGGGGAGEFIHSGSGRDPHTTFSGGSAGSGGIGGSFGGGAANGGAAGFGGGGAGSAGGWGGGGSSAAGGFGGGSGIGGAGGGLGAGGDVFVQQGGSLTIAGGSLSGGSVNGGAGSGAGVTGSAFGSGVFYQGNGNVTLAPAAGKTLTIADVIADMGGSGGSGSVSLTVAGAVTAVLSATNTYTGGTYLQAGTLSLQAPGALGSGLLYFAYGTADTLSVGAGDVPANTISGLLPGDIIDFQNIGTATSVAPGTGDTLIISGGSQTVQIALDPAQNLTGETFHVTGDGSNGTLLTMTDVNNDVPPSVSGTGTLAGDDHTPLSPLSGVAVADLNDSAIIDVTVTLSATGNGTLSNLGGGLYDSASGIYSVSGSAAQVTAALDGLAFTPTDHQVAPGGVVTTQFTLSATDGVMTSTTVTSSINITALNDPPAIGEVVSTQPVEGYWNVPLDPFPAATVTDPDLGATEAVTLSVGGNLLVGDAAGTLDLGSATSGLSLTHTGNGIYTLSAGTPSQVTAALDALQFTALPDASVPGYTISYVGVSVSDGIAPAVTTQVQVLTGLPIFSGTVADQTVFDGQTTSPFGSVAVTDSASLSIQGFTITLYDSSSGFSTPTDANGTLSGTGLTYSSVGTYTLAAGSTSAVSTALDALVFTPSSNSVPVTTEFVLSAFDGATTASNYDTAVTAEVACFLAGTGIMTERGEVPVQDLEVGDRVVTLSGAVRSIAWIGEGRVLVSPGRRCAATPVLVCKGALAPNVPHRDLRVTKGHSLFLDGVLIPAEFLVNHRSILWDDRTCHVSFYHIELDAHDVVIANGASAESYRDDGNRWMFRNANSAWGQPPKLVCAPVLTGGPPVDAIWRRLLERAGPRPGLPLTDDPHLHVLVDRRPLAPARVVDGAYTFRLSSAPKEVRVISRAGVPAELGLARDPRMLGVALREVRVWHGARLRALSASDPLLDLGFHAFEADNGWRWTSGDATLPPALFTGLEPDCELQLLVAGTMRYPMFEGHAA